MPTTISPDRTAVRTSGVGHEALVSRIVDAHPTLTPTRERMLLRRVQSWNTYRHDWAAQHGDRPLPPDLQIPLAARRGKEAHETLVLAHVRFVHAVAREVRTPSHVAIEDLVAVGMEGLIRAVDTFDPGRRNRLMTYARPWIRNLIADWLRLTGDLLAVPRSWQIVEWRVARLVADGTGRGNQADEAALIAAYVDAHGDRELALVQDVVATGSWQRGRTGSLDEDPDAYARIPCSVPGPEVVVMGGERTRDVNTALRSVLTDGDGVVDEDAVTVATLYYGLGAEQGRRWTVSEIATMMGSTSAPMLATVRAIEAALERAADRPEVAGLRAYLEA